MHEDELDNLDPDNTRYTCPIIGGDAAALKQLANDESVEKLGLQVQPDGKCVPQLKERKDTVEDWTRTAKNRPPPDRSGVAKLHTSTLV